MLNKVTLKKYGAVTNGLRHQIKLDKTNLLKYSEISKNTFQQHHYRKGRSKMHGKITAWHRGGGHKKRLRHINLDNSKKEAITIGTTYDPNRSAFISILFNLKTKKFFNILSTSKLYPGSIHETNIKLGHKATGNRTMLQSLPIGTLINNISIGTKTNGKFVRSAGTYAQIISIKDKKTKIKLPSNKIITLPSHSYATIGTLSNELHNKQVIGKAGIKRALGRRPITRGIAMNPVDHPHGGRSNGGKPSVTPWGLPTKCKFSLKTRKKKKEKKIMSRSKWKRQYISKHIIKLTKKKNTLHQPVKIYSRSSIIPASLIGKSVLIHYGKDFKKLTITAKHIGYKFGEFAFTRKFTSKDKKVKK